MTSAEFTAWIIRSLALALATLLAHRACPAGRSSRSTLPLLGFAGLLALTGHEYWHGPQLSLAPRLALPPALTEWPAESAMMPSHWLAGIWLTGAAFLLGRDLLGAWRLHAVIRASRPLVDTGWQQTLDECRAPLGLTATIELRVSSVLGPAAAGLWRRVILLPPSCPAWSGEQRRFVLLHELAHFRHGDLLARLFARTVCAIQWFNPFAWALARRMDFDREAACDAAVVDQTATPGAYAETLLAFASSPSPTSSFAFGFGARRRSTLEARILRLLTPDASSPAWFRHAGTLLALAVFAAAGVLCACSWDHPSVAADEVNLRLTADPFPGER